MKTTFSHLVVGSSLLLGGLICFGEELDLKASEGLKPRLIIMADMGHDPDEEQQMTHMLLCSNMFELEGLIAVTGKVLNPNATKTVKTLMPQLFHRLIDGYAEVYPNLTRHASGWQTPQHLRSIIANGQPGNGVADTGEGKSSAGSQLVIASVTRPDPRPVHIVINAGANTLAQALLDYRTNHSSAEVDAFVAKLRVFENSGQDEAGAWICHTFPAIHWIRSVEQTQCYGGPSNENLGPHYWKPYPYSPAGQHQWAEENVRTNHGALGALAPVRKVGKTTHFIEGGGTIPWMGFVARGLSDSSEPSWGGWSGRYASEKAPNVPSPYAIVHADEKRFIPYAAYTENREVSDRWISPDDGKVYDTIYTSVWRWRTAMWNDYKARMDWCVRPYEAANHHPVAVLNEDASDRILKFSGKPGERINFDASDSMDPDGDTLRYSWWIYPEAGRQPYGKEVPIENSTTSEIKLTLPADAAGKELHLILEVWDENVQVPLVDYRRVVIDVAAQKDGIPAR